MSNDVEALSITDAIARVEAVLASLHSVTPATINPDGTPGNVSPGELIESAWGNAVANTIGDHHEALAILDQTSALLTITPPAPWTGTATYIRRGNWVWVSLTVARASAYTSADLLVGTLPNGWRPYPGSVYGVAHCSGATIEASRSVLLDASDGHITVLNLNLPDATGGTVRGTFTFPTNPGITIS